jgi:ribonuclease HII
MPCSFKFERALWKRGLRRVAGIDEAGRGALAGPVVAAAAILPSKRLFKGLNDSKKVSPAERERLYEELIGHPQVFWAVGEASAQEIDQLNILRATHLAMRRALLHLQEKINDVVEHALIDGLPVHPFPVPQTSVVAGDAACLSIAAASIVAKVTRDRIMQACEQTYPAHAFSKHKGYGTTEHLDSIRRHGPCAIHRMSFEPVSQTEFNFDAGPAPLVRAGGRECSSSPPETERV